MPSNPLGNTKYIYFLARAPLKLSTSTASAFFGQVDSKNRKVNSLHRDQRITNIVLGGIHSRGRQWAQTVPQKFILGCTVFCVAAAFEHVTASQNPSRIVYTNRQIPCL